LNCREKDKRTDGVRLYVRERVGGVANWKKGGFGRLIQGGGGGVIRGGGRSQEDSSKKNKKTNRKRKEKKRINWGSGPSAQKKIETQGDFKLNALWGKKKVSKKKLT